VANAEPAAFAIADTEPNHRFDTVSTFLVFVFHQTTLVAMFAVFFMLSGAMVALAVSQVREPACNPQPNKLRTDDGFWVLLGQVFQTILSTYFTVYAVVLNDEVKGSVAGYWFWSSLAIGATTTMTAVVVYSWSWQISTIFSFVSGVMLLIPAGQLAASLGSEDLGARLRERVTCKLEEGRTE